MTFKKMDCFLAYDVRGKLGVNFDNDAVYRISRALSQHLATQKVVVGYDARETSPGFAQIAANGILDAGADVITIGMAGTEEMYWAVTQFGACAGILITASHNPINYNGIKMVKSGSRPLDFSDDFIKIKQLAENGVWKNIGEKGVVFDVVEEAREKYVNKVLSFIDVSKLKPMRIVVNFGNGAAGPTFDYIKQKLDRSGSAVSFVQILAEPDSSFPYGIPNPLLPENQSITCNSVKTEKADMGVAFDGDFDRCFFFDETGRFIPGEYMVGLLANKFLEKERKAKIVHDPRLVFNTLDIVSRKQGIAVQSRTGHQYIKDTMRKSRAVYGGEMSAHHYFRDFAYCDSGMIPLLLILECLSETKGKLSELVESMFAKFPSSGELNFKVSNPDVVINDILKRFSKGAVADYTDGVSLSFPTWRFNIRKSNTEPLVRLNVEAKGSLDLVKEGVKSISHLIRNYSID